MAAKVGTYSVTHESITVPVGRDRKIWIALRTNQIAGVVTVPPMKKLKVFIKFTTQLHMDILNMML